MPRTKLTYLKDIEVHVPRSVEEAERNIILLNEECNHIEKQINDSFTLGENYHGHYVDEEEFHEWLKKARTAQSIKSAQIEFLRNRLQDKRDDYIEKLKSKNDNLHKTIEDLHDKSKKLKEINKSLHGERQLYQNACWEIFSAISKDCSTEDIYNILTKTNPDYPKQYAKKHSGSMPIKEDKPRRPKKIRRFIPSQNATLGLPATSFQRPTHDEVKEIETESKATKKSKKAKKSNA